MPGPAAYAEEQRADSGLASFVAQSGSGAAEPFGYRSLSKAGAPEPGKHPPRVAKCAALLTGAGSKLSPWTARLIKSKYWVPGDELTLLDENGNVIYSPTPKPLTEPDRKGANGLTRLRARWRVQRESTLATRQKS